MMQSQRRNLLRDVIGLLATSLTTRPTDVVRKVAEFGRPGSVSPRAEASQVPLPRAQIVPPTHSVIRRG